ncbi:MAG TPA: hypothetical protein H9830_10275 [Candidatus Agrococcus pullicola]|uniref:Uncharacterized protein n=1 Tax=Candidatus Agrococcus pullicola TaxID=2838429 RepID=A0A9D2CAC6_9MICO|nr:hypothetical protein [Candidatus Agrococcus pullicola]
MAKVLTAAVALLALAGCSAEPVQPYAAAEHQGLREFHIDAAAEYLETDELLAGIGQLESYTAVGYKHGLASNGAQLNNQHTTKYVDGSYLSLEQGIHEGETIDVYHVAGSDREYYLFGRVYQEKMDIAPWGHTAAPRMQPDAHPSDACVLSAVAYACQLLRAWHYTQEHFEASDENHDDVPLHLQRYANGSVLLTTAVTVGSMVEANLWVFGGDLEQLVTDETLDTLVPMRVWINSDGVVLKMEANGTVVAPDTDLEMELQVGFEITGTATQDEISVPIENLEEENLFEMPEGSEANDFWRTIELIRIGEL